MLMQTLPREATPTLAGLIARIMVMLDCAKAGDKKSVNAITETLCAEYIRKGSTIKSARLRKAKDGKTTCIGITLEHNPRKNPPATSERLLDPMFFAAVLLLDFVGVRFQYNPITRHDKTYYYIRAGHPSRRHGIQRVYLSRIIYNAPNDTRVPFLDDHHSYLLRDLMAWKPDGSLPRPELGREDIVALARGMHETRLLSTDTVTPDEYDEVLRETLRVATEFHAKEA